MIRRAIRALIPAPLLFYLSAISHFFQSLGNQSLLFPSNDVGQKILVTSWLNLCRQGVVLPLHQVGFKVFSQFEEDGILLYLFTIVGVTNARVVELCAGNGLECMSTNLIVHHGWRGFLFDGSAERVREGIRFFERFPSTFQFPPSFQRAWITRENINSLLATSGVKGEIDLLSIDIDGNDLWIWKEIREVSPRVLIVETNNSIPADRALSIPYDPQFGASDNPSLPHDFRGASALAFVRMSRAKGYRLIGAHRYGFNLIFMRNDVGAAEFAEVDVQSVHDNDFTRWNQQKWTELASCDWVEIV